MPLEMSPEANYLTRSNILYPGTSTQATAAAAKARLDIAARIPANGGSTPAVTNGVITAAPV
jgi:hypothetical protein